VKVLKSICPVAYTATIEDFSKIFPDTRLSLVSGLNEKELLEMLAKNNACVINVIYREIDELKANKNLRIGLNLRKKVMIT